MLEADEGSFVFSELESTENYSVSDDSPRDQASDIDQWDVVPYDLAADGNRQDGPYRNDSSNNLHAMGYQFHDHEPDHGQQGQHGLFGSRQVGPDQVGQDDIGQDRVGQDQVSLHRSRQRAPNSQQQHSWNVRINSPAQRSRLLTTVSNYPGGYDAFMPTLSNELLPTADDVMNCWSANINNTRHHNGTLYTPPILDQSPSTNTGLDANTYVHPEPLALPKNYDLSHPESVPADGSAAYWRAVAFWQYHSHQLKTHLGPGTTGMANRPLPLTVYSGPSRAAGMLPELMGIANPAPATLALEHFRSTIASSSFHDAAMLRPNNTCSPPLRLAISSIPRFVYPPDRVPCPTEGCPETFTRGTDALRHQANYHTDLQRYKCRRYGRGCDFASNTLYYIQRHCLSKNNQQDGCKGGYIDNGVYIVRVATPPRSATK